MKILSLKLLIPEIDALTNYLPLFFSSLLEIRLPTTEASTREKIVDVIVGRTLAYMHGTNFDIIFEMRMSTFGLGYDVDFPVTTNLVTFRATCNCQLIQF